MSERLRAAHPSQTTRNPSSNVRGGQPVCHSKIGLLHMKEEIGGNTGYRREGGAEREEEKEREIRGKAERRKMRNEDKETQKGPHKRKRKRRREKEKEKVVDYGL